MIRYLDVNNQGPSLEVWAKSQSKGRILVVVAYNESFLTEAKDKWIKMFGNDPDIIKEFGVPVLETVRR